MKKNKKAFIPKAQNGIEGTMGGLTDKGFNYNGAWGGTMQMGGNIDSVLNANKNLDWVQRLYEKNTPSIKIPGQKGRSTHFMESADGRVYPTVVRMPNGKLKYLGDKAYDYADSTKTYIQFPSDEEAQQFSKDYKKGTNVLKNFQMGGNLPTAQIGDWLKKTASVINPFNWGVTDYSDKKDFDSAYASARNAGEKEFMWNNQRFSTNMKGTPSEQLKWSGITDDRLGIQGKLERRAYKAVRPSVYDKEEDVKTQVSRFIKGEDRFDLSEYSKLSKELQDADKKQDYTKAKSILKKLESFDENLMAEDDPYSEDAWRIYLGMPQKNSSFGISEYKPTISKGDKNVNYYNLPESFKNELADLYQKGQIKVGLNNEFDFSSKFGQNQSQARALGNFTVGKGKDEKGEYISYYDIYDLTPTLSSVGKVDIENFVGKPFEIYDRVYINPKKDKSVVDKKQQGGNLPGAMGNMYARHGAPSEGKYAKKTLPSAQDGTNVKKPTVKLSPDELKMERLKQYVQQQSRKEQPSVQSRGSMPDALRKQLYEDSQSTDLKEQLIKGADIATDVMQLGNFIPHPIGQAIGKVGNVAGAYIDAAQAAGDIYNGNYASGAINAASVALPFALGSQTFRRNSKYLRPGQPLYPFSPQAGILPGGYSRKDYIEPFTKVKGMTDKSLLANRALLGTLGAETVYDSYQNGGEMKFYQQGLDFKPKTISKNGGWLSKYEDIPQAKQGIKKDDNGYWNPDNWGKPVEIGSNEITMDGVYQPLLGISNTGDVQMMYPGEDYTFDGESVTEYPVAQNGKKMAFEEDGWDYKGDERFFKKQKETGETRYGWNPGRKQDLYRTITPYKTRAQIKKFTPVPENPEDVDFIANYSRVKPTSTVNYQGDDHWNIPRFLIEPHISEKRVEAEGLMSDGPQTRTDYKKNILADVFKYQMLQNEEDRDKAWKSSKVFMRKNVNPLLRGEVYQTLAEKRRMPFSTGRLTNAVGEYFFKNEEMLKSDSRLNNPFMGRVEKEYMEQPLSDKKVNRYALDWLTKYKKMPKKEARQYIKTEREKARKEAEQYEQEYKQTFENGGWLDKYK